MAQAQVVDSRLVRIWINAPPGAVGPPASILICAMTTKGFNQTKNTNTAVIPDCTDPTVVAPVKRTPISIDAQITGTGYYEPEHRGDIQALFDSAVSSLVYFEIPNGEAPIGDAGYYSGKFFLTTFNITADEGNYARAEMTWEADGQVAWTTAVPALTAEMQARLDRQAKPAAKPAAKQTEKKAA